MLIIQNYSSKKKQIRHKIKKNGQKKKLNTNLYQNQVRNIFSNIARLVINFVTIESKSKVFLLQILQGYQEEIKLFLVGQFYKEAVNQKKKIKSVYLSKSTFYKFLGLQIPSQVSQDQKKPQLPLIYTIQTSPELYFRRIFRQLAYYYLHSILQKQIIHSKKIKVDLKQSHLKIGRQLLNSLKLSIRHQGEQK